MPAKALQKIGRYAGNLSALALTNKQIRGKVTSLLEVDRIEHGARSVRTAHEFNRVLQEAEQLPITARADILKILTPRITGRATCHALLEALNRFETQAGKLLASSSAVLSAGERANIESALRYKDALSDPIRAAVLVVNGSEVQHPESAGHIFARLREDLSSDRTIPVRHLLQELSGHRPEATSLPRSGTVPAEFWGPGDIAERVQFMRQAEFYEVVKPMIREALKSGPCIFVPSDNRPLQIITALAGDEIKSTAVLDGPERTSINDNSFWGLHIALNTKFMGRDRIEFPRVGDLISLRKSLRRKRPLASIEVRSASSRPCGSGRKRPGIKALRAPAPDRR
ncbi:MULTISPECIES: hypothetical protein [Chelativorans]|jgi:hypothetical protein|nr:MULTISPECIES: hypothetical protein [Chelativorans]